MAWQYSDYEQQSGNAAKAARLRLHIQEVSDKITADYEADGFKKTNSPLRTLRNELRDRLRELESAGVVGRRYSLTFRPGGRRR